MNTSETVVEKLHKKDNLSDPQLISQSLEQANSPEYSKSQGQTASQEDVLDSELSPIEKTSFSSSSVESKITVSENEFVQSDKNDGKNKGYTILGIILICLGVIAFIGGIAAISSNPVVFLLLLGLAGILGLIGLITIISARITQSDEVKKERKEKREKK